MKALLNMSKCGPKLNSYCGVHLIRLVMDSYRRRKQLLTEVLMLTLIRCDPRPAISLRERVLSYTIFRMAPSIALSTYLFWDKPKDIMGRP